MAKFGEATGVWIYEIIRGNCNDAVTERNLVKMLSCCKNFQPPIHQIQKAEYWISVLASEMYTRAHDDYEINERWPKTLTFHWRSHSESKSKSCAFPNRFFIRSPDDVLAKCLLLFRQTIDSRQTSSSSSSISSSSILTSCNQRKISISSLSFRLSGLGKEESSTSVATFFKKVTAEELANARRIELTSSASADNIYSCGTSKSSSSIGGIDSFFTNSMIEHRVVAEVDNNNKDDDFSHVCESCSKRIPLQELEEHQDYHLALKLQREITGDQIGMSPFSSSSQSLKRKSSAATKGGSSSSKKNSNTSTIAKFFKR